MPTACAGRGVHGMASRQRDRDDIEDLIRRQQQPDDEPLDLKEWDAGLDNDPIPPRGWLLGNLLCRQFLSSIFGTGEVGKTAVMIVLALCLATGRALIGEHVFQRCKVLLVCFEDGRDELRRRVAAAMLHHRVSKTEVRDHLFLSAVSRRDAKFASLKYGELKDGKLGDALETSIRRHGIDAVFLDPFVKTHAVDENDREFIRCAVIVALYPNA